MTYNGKTIKTQSENGKWYFEIPELNIIQRTKPFIGGNMETELEAQNVAQKYIDYRAAIDAKNETIKKYMEGKQKESEIIENDFKNNI